MASRSVLKGSLLQALGKQRYLTLSLLFFLLSVRMFSVASDSTLFMYLTMILVIITGPLSVARNRLQLSVGVGLVLTTLISGVIASTGGPPNHLVISLTCPSRILMQPLEGY